MKLLNANITDTGNTDLAFIMETESAEGRLQVTLDKTDACLITRRMLMLLMINDVFQNTTDHQKINEAYVVLGEMLKP